MLQTLEQIKHLIGLEPESIGLTGRLRPDHDEASGAMSDWDLYLSDAAAGTTSLLSHWTGKDLSQPGVLEQIPSDQMSRLRRAEILLLRAEIVLDHGASEAVEPGDIQAGGSEGIKVTLKRLPLDERGAVASELRSRARLLVKGDEGTFAGVL